MRLLRLAIENSEEPTVIMKGPLSDVYADALNKAYAKDDEEKINDAIETSMESQAIDSTIAKKIIDALKPSEAPPTDNFQTVYGVAKDKLTDEVVVDITKDMANNASTSSDDNYVLIIDTTQISNDNVPEQKTEIIQQALECMAEAHRVTVYHSLKEYVNSKR